MGNSNILRPPDQPHGGCLSCRYVRPGSITRYKGGYMVLHCEQRGPQVNQPIDQIVRGCWLWKREPGTDDEEPNFPYQ